jgi:hypothetical protein
MKRGPTIERGRVLTVAVGHSDVDAGARQLRTGYIVLVVLILLAVSTRILPLAISPLPYNQDGLTECRIATDLQQTGHLRLPDDAYYADTHSVATPVYNLLLAFASSVLGSPVVEIAQLVIGAISVLTIVGGYLVARLIVGRMREAMVAGLILGLFGTFVFLTGSTWKESLGVAMLVLLFYAYSKRSDLRMFVLEIVILATIPFIHHLVAVLGYFAIAYLTIWSVLYAVKNRSITKRHLMDIWVMTMLGAGAYLYYVVVELDRLSYVSIEGAMIAMVLIFLGLSAAMYFWLTMKKHSRFSFAAIPPVFILSLFLIDYFHPLFPYSPGSPLAVVILAVSVSVIIGFAWLGVEDIVESTNAYRALPLGMLLPVMTLFAFSLTSGFSLAAHQTLYRSFDFADIGLAVGAALGVMHFRKRPRVQMAVISTVIAALLLTMPFAYATDGFTGVRHDTQEYEVDALGWLHDSAGPANMLQSDERLSYIGMALFDFVKMPYLPTRLVEQQTMGIDAFYVMEDEWTTEGVNNYPNGHPVIDSSWFSLVLSSSNVMYIGGPSDDRILIYTVSIQGQDAILGHH